MQKLKKINPIIGPKRAKKIGLQSSRFRQNYMSQDAEDQLEYTKKKDRSYLKKSEWAKQKYYETNATQILFNCPDQIDRVDVADLSVEDFVQKYQKKNKPVIIKSVTKDWKIQKYWTLNAFYDRYKDAKFKVGEDDKGKKIRIKLKYYLEYMIHNKDDSPLYLFQSSLQSREQTRDIIDHYKVPKYFREDFLSYAGQKNRPPYRWLLLGPQRSGTTVHIDPLYTSAWNTSLCGHKRWVLFHQSIPKSIVKGYEFKQEGKQDEAINYFLDILPKILQKQKRQNLGVIEFIQYPHETVFIPGGWWHAVINLDDTFAVTQNVMTSTNFSVVWKSLRKERRKFARYFLKKLQLKAPQLYTQAIAINNRDNWIMGERTNRRVSISYTPTSSSSSSSSSPSSSSQSSDSDQSKSRSRQKKNHKKSESRSKTRDKKKK